MKFLLRIVSNVHRRAHAYESAHGPRDFDQYGRNIAKPGHENTAPTRRADSIRRRSKRMTLPLPFLHIWRRLVWDASVPFLCRECRICGRFELFAYGSWRSWDKEALQPIVLWTPDKRAWDA